MEETLLPERLASSLDRQVVLLGGAGLSQAPPSSLPGWNGLNELVVTALSGRIDGYLDRPGFTAGLHEVIGSRRSADQFPPDFQAQLIHELSGEDYFRALQCVDVGVRSRGHDAVGWMAANGVLAAVVTTNFDRLIEQALEAHGVTPEVAFDERGYTAMLGAMEAGTLTGLPVIKIHGCASDPESLVDTLQQRLRGRNRAADEILRRLLERYYWIYAGFSAADLETDEDYLQIRQTAARSPGCTYVVWPGSPELTAGAELLVASYEGRAETVTCEFHELVESIANGRGWGDMASPAPTQEPTSEHVESHLRDWAQSLHPAEAVNCLAGLAEAAGQAPAAFDLLHRFWKDVRSEERSGADFARYRYLHGRLGIGHGYLSVATGLKSDQGMESLQNLLRVSHDQGWTVAESWAGLAFVWAGDLQQARSLLSSSIDLLRERMESESDALEVANEVDSWIALAQAFFIIGEPEAILDTWRWAADRASKDGDLPRQALVTSLAALSVAEFQADEYPKLREGAVADLMKSAARLHHPAVSGFLGLADGRYLTTMQRGDEAVQVLDGAIVAMRHRPPWWLYGVIQHAKSLIDAGRADMADQQLDGIFEYLDNYPVFRIWFGEARGQWNRALGHEEHARRNFEASVDIAEEMTLTRRAEALRQYLA